MVYMQQNAAYCVKTGQNIVINMVRLSFKLKFGHVRQSVDLYYSLQILLIKSIQKDVEV